MRAGWMRHRVTVQKAQRSQGTHGEERIAWQDVGTFWASVEPIRGREKLDPEHVFADTTTRIRMRFYPTQEIVPQMRVVWKSLPAVHTYDVQSVIRPLERNVEQILMCREVLDE